jgi:hypothetical protein
MMKPILLTVVAALAVAFTLDAQNKSPEQLAAAVVKASGGDAWPRVKTLDFTFNVEQNGKLLVSAKHHWDIAAGRDTVEWDGSKVTADVSGSFAVNVNAVPDNVEEAMQKQKEAHKRWTNDSYWLLAPLKLRDRGTHLADKGGQTIEGKTYHVLELSFDAVGLTSKDKYNLYIDPETNLLAHWEYMPSLDKTVSGTWENYQDFGGLKLATEHKFGDKRIYFTEIRVE